VNYSFKKNYKFIIILFNASIIGLIFPDFDSYNIQTNFFQNFIGHRSILTHSILVPYLFYFYAKKKHKLNNNVITIIIGLFLGLALHLTADIYPKNGNENELIKLPGNISIGKFTFLWISLNTLVSFYISKVLLNDYFNKKYYRTIYLIIGLLLVCIYILLEPYNRIIILITSIILLLITYFYDKKTDQKLVNLLNLKKN
jgi:MFS family permease